MGGGREGRREREREREREGGGREKWRDEGEREEGIKLQSS